MLPALLGGTVDFGIPSVLSAAGQRERLRVLHVFGPPSQGLNGLFAPDYLGSADFARVVAEDYCRKGEMIKRLPMRR